MRVSQVLSGVASGYGTRLVQLMCMLGLVPFFLREDVLGIDGYGLVFTILAISGLLRFFVDGIRQSFIRDVSSTIVGPRQEFLDCFGTRFRFLLLLCTVLATSLALLSTQVVGIAGIPRADAASLRLAAGLFWVENSFVLFNVVLVNRGRVAFVNVCVAAEVVARSLAYVVVFSIRPASIELFFGIQVVFAVARSLVIVLAVLRLERGLFVRLFVGRCVPRMGSMTYSLPVSVYQITDELGYRLPIIISNTMLGPEASGYVALALNTTRRYAVQTLYSVLSPMAIPLGARVDPRRASASFCRNLWEFEAGYALFTTLGISSVVAVAPEVLSAWLGGGYESAILPIQILLCSASVEISTRIRHAILLGQGLLGHALPTIASLSVVTLGASLLAALGQQDWQVLVYIASFFYLGSSVAGISWTFWRQVGRGAAVRAPSVRIVAAVVLSVIVSVVLSRVRLLGSALDLPVAIFANGIACLAIFHLSVLRIGTVRGMLARVRSSLDSDLLEGSGTEPPTSSSPSLPTQRHEGRS